MKTTIAQVFRTPGIADFAHAKLLRASAALGITDIQTECCYNVEFTDSALTLEEFKILAWLLAETFEHEKFSRSTFLKEVTIMFWELLDSR